MVELDRFHAKEAAPLGLVPQTILERPLGFLLSDEELYRFRVVKLGERIQTHRVEPYSASRGEATVSRSRHRCLGGQWSKLGDKTPCLPQAGLGYDEVCPALPALRRARLGGPR